MYATGLRSALITGTPVALRIVSMLTYSLANRGDESLYVYLYHCLRRDIEEGVIAAGQRLPSKRAFAEHLGVSVITVEGAYAQLQAEGYIQAVPRRGYYASAVMAAPPAAHTSRLSVSLTASAPVPPPIADLTGSGGGSGVFPYALWAKVVRAVLTCESEDALMREAHAAGSPRLRQAVASYLRGSRGMEVDPACIVVGAGAQVLYNAIVQLLGRRDHRYAVENPGYPRLTSIYGVNDVDLVHIPLGEQGIAMDSLAASGASVVHIMPSHQYPTGLVTSVGRRYELLAWASGAPERYIVEDDYDCEFRLAGRPIPSLQSIDACGRVIYTNTFAKSLGAAFRLGYMVLPPALAEVCTRKLGFYSCTVSVIEQLTLARFIEEGHYERHVAKARMRYRQTRDALIAALRGSAFSHRLAIEGADGGLHFLMGLSAAEGSEAPLPSEAVLCERARERGVLLAPLSSFAVPAAPVGAGPFDPERRWFVVGYGTLDPAAIPQLVAVLESVIAQP